MPVLRCPSCGSEGRWALLESARSDAEVREGSLTCEGCGRARGVQDGIVDLLEQPPGFVTREAAGLGRFAELMRSDGWDRRRVLELPYVELGYWYGQAIAMQQVLAGGAPGLRLNAGERILDVGSNTCWASAMFAERGLDVIALDIATHEMQGLRTADWWFEEKQIYFERVLSVMFEPALSSESVDLVWCSEVLHHNHRSNLERTLSELFRVLKPGGKLIVVNEPVRGLRSPKFDQGAEVAEFEGHEHVYLRRGYLRAARKAGFHVALFGTPNMGPFNDGTLGISSRMSSFEGFRVAFAHLVRRSSPLRQAYLWWKTYVDGLSLSFVATKPARSIKAGG